MVGETGCTADLQHVKHRWTATDSDPTHAPTRAPLPSPVGVAAAGLHSQDQVLDRTIAVGITIEQQLRRNTITLGSDPAVELVDLNIDWQANPPLIRARVRVTNPQLPTQAQVAAPL